MYYFYVQLANGNAFLVQVENYGNMVWDVASAKREAKRMMNAYTAYDDYAIKEATVEDIAEQFNFDKNIARLH